MANLKGITVTAINPNKASTKNGKLFIKGVNSMRNNLLKNGYTDSQYADIARNAVNIMSGETKQGTRFNYRVRNIFTPKTRQWLRNIRHPFQKLPLSHGLSQIKIQNSDSKYLKSAFKKFNINEQTLEQSPYQQGQATVLKILDNRKKYPGQYNWKTRPMSSEEKDAILWNRGKITNNINIAPENIGFIEKILGQYPAEYIDEFNKNKIL